MISTQAKTIRCFRNHLAWTVVRRLREERATVMLQRAYRGWRGRQAFLVKMRQIWAAHVIQRAWRGFSGRGFFTLLKTMHAAAAQMQRTARGLLARLLVQGMQQRRHRAATMLQTLWRQVTARYATFELRNRSYAARTVERAYRGHLGRSTESPKRTAQVPLLEVAVAGHRVRDRVEIKFRAPHAIDAMWSPSCVCSMAWRLHAIDATWSP